MLPTSGPWAFWEVSWTLMLGAKVQPDSLDSEFCLPKATRSQNVLTPTIFSNQSQQGHLRPHSYSVPSEGSWSLPTVSKAPPGCRGCHFYV